MSPQTNGGSSALGLAMACVTFWQERGLHPPAGLAGVGILAFTSHFETHFLIQERICHAEAALTPFLGSDWEERRPEHMGITISVRTHDSPLERLQPQAK